MSATEPSMRALDPDASARGVSDGAELPPHATPTYYDRPLLKKPHWEWEVILYLLMGGAMGGSGILTALADERGDDAALARSARYVAFALASTCPLVLIKHLGRPERFLHMLRIFKWKSPMSMGVWGLIAFSAPAAAAAAGQLARDGLVPARVRFVRFLAPRSLTNPLQLVLGAFICGYTGVLLSATANPLWAAGKRHIPAISVCSGVAGGCALNNLMLALFGGNESTRQKLDRLEAVAGIAELAALLSFRQVSGAAGAPMFAGPRGRRLRNATMLGGIVAPTLINLIPVHARAKSALSAVLTLCGAYVLRETLVEAGKESADDPRVSSRQPE